MVHLPPAQQAIARQLGTYTEVTLAEVGDGVVGGPVQEEGGQLQPDGAHPGLGGHGVAAAGSLAPAWGTAGTLYTS